MEHNASQFIPRRAQLEFMESLVTGQPCDLTVNLGELQRHGLIVVDRETAQFSITDEGRVVLALSGYTPRTN